METVQIPCPRCGSELRLQSRDLLGRRGRCPQCGHRFVLQEPDEIELDLVDPSERPTPESSPQWPSDQAPATRQVSNTTPPDALLDSPNVNDAPSPFVEIGDANQRIVKTPRGKTIRRRSKRSKSSQKTVTILMWTVVVLSAVLAGVYIATKSQQPEPDTNRSETETPDTNPDGTNPDADDAAVKVVVRSKSDKRLLRKKLQIISSTAAEYDSPIDLRLIPTGAGIVINLRPADLWRNNKHHDEFRKCLGPLADWVESQLRAICLFEPAEIEEALICPLLGKRGDPPEIAAVVRLVDAAISTDALIKRFEGTLSNEFDHPVYLTSKRAYLIENLKTFAVVPRNRDGAIMEMVLSREEANATAVGIEQLLTQTDRRRHLTLVFEPLAVRNHQEFLVPDGLRDLLNQFLDFLGDDVQTAVLSVHLGESLQTELLLRNESLTRPEIAQLEQFVRRRITDLPGNLRDILQNRRPPAALGRYELVGRLPAMMEAFSRGTTTSIGRQQVRVATLLPGDRPAPNLALAARLTWDEFNRPDSGTGSPPATPPSTNPKPPDSVIARLKTPVEIEFNRTPLNEAFAYIGEETSVTFNIDGAALKLSAYTKNMPQTFTLGTVPATRALHEILQQYSEMILVITNEKEKTVTVTTKAAAEEKKLTPLVIEPQ